MFRGKKGRRVYIKYVIMLAVILFFCLELDRFAHEKAVSAVNEDLVPSVELAGYLQIIPLTPEETRTLILPDMGEYITGEDVYELLDYLRMDKLADTVRKEAAFGEEDFLTYSISHPF